MRGLVNLGATCYLNSAVWALLGVHDCIPPDNETSREVLKLKTVFCPGDKPPQDTRPLFEHLRRRTQSFKAFQQDDAHDALLQLLEAMNTPYAFAGKTQIVLKEPDKKRYGPEEAFTVLTVPVQGCTTIGECVRMAFAKETVQLDGKPVVKWTKCLQAPRVLVLHLNRFNPSDGSRNNKHIEYCEDVEITFSGKSLPYKLYYICLHQGNANSGHYTCAVQGQCGEWYLINDHIVRLVGDVEELMDLPEAYMLGYRLTTTAQT